MFYDIIIRCVNMEYNSILTATDVKARNMAFPENLKHQFLVMWMKTLLIFVLHNIYLILP